MVGLFLFHNFFDCSVYSVKGGENGDANASADTNEVRIVNCVFIGLDDWN